MKYGLTQAQYDFVFAEAVQPLSALGLTVFVYGSRARSSHHQFSDLDLMIEGPKTTQAEKLVATIQEKFSNRNFPYKVDLVFLSDFAESYKPGYEKDKIKFVRSAL
jgi:predicted nucleotidyltransferase